MEQDQKLSFYLGRFGQLVPLLVALIFILIAATHESNVNGYSIAFFVAIIVGCLFARNRRAYGEAAIEGLSRPMFGTVAIAIIFAAIAGKLVSASGMIDTMARLLLDAQLSGGAFCAISFLLCCLLSMSTGTSVGTYVITMPILFPVGVLVGVAPAFMIGAIVSGGLFGDNLAPISDTTIASAGTQGAEMGAVVRTRCWYSLPIAAACFLAYFLLGGSGAGQVTEASLTNRPLSLLMLLIPVVVIILCLLKLHLIVALSFGILTGCVIGLVFGLYSWSDLFRYPGNFTVGGLVYEAISGTSSTIFMLIGAFMFLGIIEKSGLINVVAHGIFRISHGRKSAELSIVLAIGILGAITGVCTVSMIALGDVVRRVGEEYGIDKCRRANLMDCGGLCLTSLAPWTVHAVYPVTLAATSNPDIMISPPEVVFHNYYGLFMVVMMLVAILTGYHRQHAKRSS